MSTLTASTPATTTKTRNDYADGHFDAATHAAPKQTSGEYYKGYLDYTAQLLSASVFQCFSVSVLQLLSASVFQFFSFRIPVQYLTFCIGM